MIIGGPSSTCMLSRMMMVSFSSPSHYFFAGHCFLQCPLPSVTQIWGHRAAPPPLSATTTVLAFIFREKIPTCWCVVDSLALDVVRAHAMISTDTFCIDFSTRNCPPLSAQGGGLELAEVIIIIADIRFGIRQCAA